MPSKNVASKFLVSELNKPETWGFAVYENTKTGKRVAMTITHDMLEGASLKYWSWMPVGAMPKGQGWQGAKAVGFPRTYAETMALLFPE